MTDLEVKSWVKRTFQKLEGPVLAVSSMAYGNLRNETKQEKNYKLRVFRVTEPAVPWCSQLGCHRGHERTLSCTVLYHLCLVIETEMRNFLHKWARELILCWGPLSICVAVDYFLLTHNWIFGFSAIMFPSTLECICTALKGNIVIDSGTLRTTNRPHNRRVEGKMSWRNFYNHMKIRYTCGILSPYVKDVTWSCLFSPVSGHPGSLRIRDLCFQVADDSHREMSDIQLLPCFCLHLGTWLTKLLKISTKNYLITKRNS